MIKTSATSATNQLILTNSGYELEDEDIEVMIQALTYAVDQLDMDNMDAINRLQAIIKALEGAL